jgi:RNA polymerase sigma factor (TIGR02999 family)
MDVTDGELTGLLQRWRQGDREAETRLFELILPKLRTFAIHYLRGERPNHTLQSSALVNEAYIKLSGNRSIDWRNRGHFFAVAARVMRHYLIDYARCNQKPPMIPIDLIQGATQALPAGKLEQAIEIDRLLDELNEYDPLLCSVVELKYFLGLKDEEGAEALDLTRDQFQKRWLRARAWLFERMGGPECRTKVSGTNAS